MKLGRKSPLRSLPAGAPPDSVVRGGGAGRAELTVGLWGGGKGGGLREMVGAAGLMAEGNWKVLERRARAKRSGLAGWGDTPSPAPGWCSPSSALGGRLVGVLELNLCPRVSP